MSNHTVTLTPDIEFRTKDKTIEVELESVSDVRIPFEIDLELREYGVKSINLRATGKVEIEAEVTVYEGGEEGRSVDLKFTADLNLIPLEDTPSSHGSISITDLFLVVDIESMVNPQVVPTLSRIEYVR